MPQGQDKDSSNKWKNKAISRGLENKNLKRRIKELTQSRDDWKEKYQRIKKCESGDILSSEKAFGHQYALSLVLMLVMLQKYGNMSLRACRHCVICMSFVGLSFRIPSHNSIRNWACKCGCFRVLCRESLSDSYVLYVDESIVFGSEKILLILGIPIDKIPLDCSVCHRDMEVLHIGIGDSWKGEDIGTELAKIGTRTNISYIVSDEGTNLKSAYKQGNYNHIEDCLHSLANILKRFYAKNSSFETFCLAAGKTRQAFYLSKEKSRYMPPSLRGKLRFINIFPCAAWAQKMLDSWQNLPDSVQESLGFLQTEQAFIEELGEQHFIFDKVCEILKTKGFCAASKQEIDHVSAGFGKSENVKKFVQEISLYLDKISQKCESIGLKHCLCSSDIIESFFGKFKHKINPNNKNHLSEFVLTIANFTKDFDCKEVKNALEKVKIKDLKNYKNDIKNGTKK